MKVYEKITDLIGGTPLLKLTNYQKEKELGADILAKLEYFNPAGSVKDRIAYAMITDAEEKGLLKPGAVIIEPTSGNTGIGLAAVAALMYMAQYPKIYTTMGALLGLKAFVAAVLGGIGILPGAMLGGIVIGLVESFSTTYISSSMADTFVFLILIVVLVIKPAGILGKNVGEKV